MTIAAATIPGIHGYGVVASRPTAGQVGALYYATDTFLIYRDNGSSWDTLTLSAGVSLTTSEAQLSGDVTMTTINTYYDGPTLSLAAGTWLLFASVSFTNAAATFFTAKLWDGTTNYASGNAMTAAGGTASIGLMAKVSPGSTITYKVSVAGNTAGSTLYATAPTNAAGATAATIVAVKTA